MHIFDVFNNFCFPLQLQAMCGLGLSVLFPAVDMLLDLQTSKLD